MNSRRRPARTSGHVASPSGRLRQPGLENLNSSLPAIPHAAELHALPVPRAAMPALLHPVHVNAGLLVEVRPEVHVQQPLLLVET